MTSDDFLSGLRQRLGVPADSDLDENGLLAALDEALQEQTETQLAIPEGLTLVDQMVLDDLVAGRNQQLAAHRAAVVEDAITTGRIPVAKRQDWLNALETDPASEQTLMSLAPGLIPVEARGHAGDPTATVSADPGHAAAVAAWGEDY